MRLFFDEGNIVFFYIGLDPKELTGIKVSIKELDDVLLRDVGGKITESGR